MEIAILRHGMPEPIPESPVSAANFINWIDRYNTAGLSETSLPPKNAVAYANHCNAIISSSLKRSMDSAKALSAAKLVLPDEQFIEAGLPSANWDFLKLLPKNWAIIFRSLWFLGYANHSESSMKQNKGLH